MARRDGAAASAPRRLREAWRIRLIDVMSAAVRNFFEGRHTMHAVRAAALTVAFGLTSAPLAAQQRLIPGYLDPASGLFHARPAQPTAATTALNSYTGTFSATFTITIDSAIASSNTITCNLNVSATGPIGSYDYYETATATATRTGNTASCTVKLPYAWKLPTGSTYSVGYGISTVQDSTGQAQRDSLFNGGPSIAVPPAGTRTDLAYAVTL